MVNGRLFPGSHARLSAIRGAWNMWRPGALVSLLAFAVSASCLLPAAANEPRPSFACAAQDDAVTCAALGSLYAATGGAAWSDAGSGWADAAAGLLRPPLCSFAGVSCAAGALTSLCVQHARHATQRALTRPPRRAGA